MYLQIGDKLIKVETKATASCSSSDLTITTPPTTIQQTTESAIAITDTKECEKKIWTEEETKELLELYKENKDEFKIKKLLWKMCSQKMNENNIKVSAEQCETRFKNLSKTFRAKMDKGNRSGGGSERPWEYMDIMLDIYDQRRNIFPKNLSNIGTLPGENQNGDEKDAVVPSTSIQKKTPMKTPMKKRSAEDSTMEFLRELHNERQRNVERRHEERMQCFDRFLSILEKKL